MHLLDHENFCKRGVDNSFKNRDRRRGLSCDWFSAIILPSELRVLKTE